MALSLVERLRLWEGEYRYPPGLLLEAAQRIAELEAFYVHCKKHSLPDICCPDVSRVKDA
jgi:hypothetical protein